MGIKNILMLSVICLSTEAQANNIIPKQNALNDNQIEWLNKHRSETKVGTEFQFVYFRESSGYLWSVSLNEYKKSKYYGSQDLTGFFEEVIEERKAKEIEVLSGILTNAGKMLFDLIDDGMPESTAIIIVSHTYPQFKVVDNTPIITSNNLPMVSLTLN